MRDVSIRLLGCSDLERLMVLERRQSRPGSRHQLAQMLEDASVCVFGTMVTDALLSDELVAYAVVARLPFEAELQAMLVAPEWRRHGLGASLLQAVIHQAQRWQAERLLLEVRAGNAVARQLYRCAGFVEEGRRRGYYPPLEETADASREDAVLMSRRL